jgi:hypothetical protein
MIRGAGVARQAVLRMGSGQFKSIGSLRSNGIIPKFPNGQQKGLRANSLHIAEYPRLSH